MTDKIYLIVRTIFFLVIYEIKKYLGRTVVQYQHYEVGMI